MAYVLLGYSTVACFHIPQPLFDLEGVLSEEVLDSTTKKLHSPVTHPDQVAALQQTLEVTEKRSVEEGEEWELS